MSVLCDVVSDHGKSVVGAIAAKGEGGESGETAQGSHATLANLDFEEIKELSFSKG